MFVIIIGGGRTGTQLATVLLEHAHQVHLIENRKEVLARLHRELPTEMIYEGNPIDPHILEIAGIAQADAITACTGDDADNLALCYLARTRYNTTRTIARINNPRNAWLFDEKFHVDVALNQAEILSKLIIEEMSLGDMMTLLKLRRGQFALVEEKVPAGAKAIGMTIQDMKLPEQYVIVAIIRQGKTVLPRGMTMIEIDDEVLAITDTTGASHLANLLASPNGNGRKKG